MSGLQDTWITTDEQYGDILWFQLCVFGRLNLGRRQPPLGGVVLLPPLPLDLCKCCEDSKTSPEPPSAYG